PVVLTIDDLQWGDADSLALLAEVLAPEAPPLLLIVTLRAGELAPLPGEVRELELGGLSAEDARALAETLLCQQAAPAERATQIVGEAAGHPLFIAELVRQRGPGL